MVAKSAFLPYDDHDIWGCESQLVIVENGFAGVFVSYDKNFKLKI